MSKAPITASTLQTNFTAGELSDFIDGRVDYPPLSSAVKIAENFIVLPEGGAFRRKGSKLVAPAFSDSTKSRLIPFLYNTSQTYALEFANNKLRFFTDRSRLVESAKTITGITKANPGVVTSASHGYSNGDLVVLGAISGMTELNGKEVTVANVATNTFELSGVNTTSYGTYTSGGTAQRVYQITTSYPEANLFSLKKAQKNDVTYFVDGAHWPQKLVRVGNLSWTIADVEFIKGPFMAQNIVSTDVIKISGTYTEGGSVTMTASGGHTPFLAGHVGSYWKLANNAAGTDLAYVKITAFTSTTVVTAQVKFGAVPASLQNTNTQYWNEGSFSSVRGFPKAIVMHEARLVLAGTTAEPNKIWLSVSNGDFENFTTSTAVTAAFDITANTGNQDGIEWLESDEVLFAGSANTIFRIKSSTTGSAISNTDADIKPQSRFGSSPLQPAFVGESPFYVERGLTKIRSLGFSVAKDKYSASNATIRSRQVTGTGITQMEYQQNPVSLLLANRIDGQVASLTYEEEQQVFAWTRQTTNGEFESLTILPTPDSVDTIYLAVKRTINGVTKRFIETIDLTLENTDGQCFYVDCGLTYDGTKATTLTLSAVTGSSVTATAGAPTFAATDVGKFIHELGALRGRGEITAYTSATQVTIKVLEDFSATGLVASAWGIAVLSVSGLDHLEGETVDVFADGATLPVVVVASGGVTFAEGSLAGVVVHVGLNYVSKIRPMVVDVGFAAPSGVNSIHNKVKKLGLGYALFYESRGGSVVVAGRADIVGDVLMRSQYDVINKGVPLFSGFKEISINSDSDRLPIFDIVQREPQPMHIKTLTTNIEVNG
ncbi:Ubiquitin-activating enzyme E1, FCCH domain containing protein [uncultured Caudovirales phage]|uniref:Ubiquitin-activating enzyme E1, FCCH domain containing protein n=1 Tax=uncultured Caudovirales phage TaxID=2100421 RepID=A0A6J5SGK8_9CAUD|nr:Ubiquitin-activating enzyme E1, FCCH domain containing protein [uncultured Caudovirales phage]